MNGDQTNLNTDISNKATTHNEQSSRNNHRLFPVSTYTKTENPSDPESKAQKQNENPSIKYVTFSKICFFFFLCRINFNF